MTDGTADNVGAATRTAEQTRAEARANKPHTEGPAPGKAGWSVTRLFSDLVAHLARLIRQEVALATTEISDNISQLGAGTGLVAAGALLAYAALLCFLAAAVLALGKLVSLWLAALIVGAIVVAIGAELAWSGKRRLQAENLVPRRTLRTLKDDREWVAQQVR
jgi:putative superfamily III holin-X